MANKWNKVQTISNFLKLLDDKNDFPVVVKTCGSTVPYKDQEESTRLPQDTDIMLEKKICVQYAHIRVLPLHDKDRLMKDKGEDYVMEHENFENEELLLPLNYPGKLKIIPRPGTRMRYGSIAQVIDDLPRFIRCDTDTMAIAKETSVTDKLIGKQTLLEIKGVTSSAGAKLLECSDGKQTYVFKENCRVNFTAFLDTKVYTLQSLQTNFANVLPKVIQFQDVDPYDIVFQSDEMASGMLSTIGSPIELLGCVMRDILVGWIRDKQKRSYKTVLIPHNMWNTEFVQLRPLEAEIKANFLDRKYGFCKDSDFVRNTLYFLYVERTEVTFLRSPNLYRQRTEGDERREILPVYFNDSSGEEPPDYEEPPDVDEPPSVPGRSPISAQVPLPTRIKSMERAQRKSIKFFQVHSELFQWFNRRSKKNPEKPSSRERKRNDYKPVVLPKSTPTPAPRSSLCETPSSKSVGNNNDGNETEVQSPIVCIDSVPPNISKVSLGKRPLPPCPTDRPPVNLPPFSPDISVPNRPSSSYDYPEPGEWDPKRLDTLIKPGYVKVNSREQKNIYRDNQTPDDFYKYSVVEVAECFRICALDKLGKECYQQRVDGEFLRNFDSSQLTSEPFNLTPFEVLKVKKIIFEGWRPKLDDCVTARWV